MHTAYVSHVYKIVSLQPSYQSQVGAPKEIRSREGTESIPRVVNLLVTVGVVTVGGTGDEVVACISPVPTAPQLVRPTIQLYKLRDIGFTQQPRNYGTSNGSLVAMNLLRLASFKTNIRSITSNQSRSIE